jgi:transposase
MARTPITLEPLESIVAAALRGELDERCARQLYARGAEAVTFILMAMARRLAEQSLRIAGLQAHAATRNDASVTPSTPSGMIPVYAKPGASRRRKKPGAKDGHPGARRARPERIDRYIEHRLPRCPDCGGPLQRCHRSRTRVIEDIPEEITPVVTEHTLHRDYCPNCKKDVEPVVTEAMPGATLGNRIVGLTSWFHYALGITIAQIIQIFSYHLRTRLTSGGLIDAWRRQATVLLPWYEQIAEEARNSAVLHGDETGWRVDGQTHWLWCFANHNVCYYMIDRCRGSPALQKFFGEAFAGTLIHDFWAPYELIETADRQYCLVHLLRELEKVDEHNASTEWQAFAKKLRRLIRDGIRLRKRPDFTPQRYRRRIHLIDARLTELAQWQRADGRVVYRDADTLRLAKRLRSHWDHLFTFLDKPEVPFDNNFAERQIRPAVILRKNSQSNRSQQGAATQAVLMSVYRTLKLRGYDPIQTVAAAMQTYLATGQLPPLPAPAIANG